MEEINQDQKELSIAFTTVSEKWYKRDSFRKILNITTGILIVLLAPFTVAAIISQNAIPGDSLYPLKRSLENMVLTAAAVSPATRAAFRTDLANRRFIEAQKLLVDKRDASGLTDFVSEIQITQLELQRVSDPKQKEELTKKLIVSIAQYEEKLSYVQTQIATVTTTQTIPSTLTSPPFQPSSPTSDSILTITPTTVVSLEKSKALPTSPTNPPIGIPTRVIATPTLVPTLSPTEALSTPRPTSVPTLTSTTISTTIPTPILTQPTSTNLAVGRAVGQTQEELKRIRHELEREQRRNRSQSEPESEQGQSIVPNQEVSNKERESRSNREKANKRNSKQSRED